MSEKGFGPVVSCDDLDEVVQVHGDVVGDGARAAVAAYAMLVAARAAPQGRYRVDGLQVLNRLGLAKARLDAQACHTKPTVVVTATVLAKAQAFVDEATIACAEWATSEEVVAAVATAIEQYAFAGPWRRHVHGSRGEIIGVEDVR